MLKVGLTGNIGVGKTTVGNLLAEKGAYVVNADSMVHALLRSGTQVWERIAGSFGKNILTHGKGEIDRKALARIVFSDKEALKWLLEIIYPPLMEGLNGSMASASAQGFAVFVFDASQLLEAGFDQYFDSIILVKASFAHCRARLLDAGRFSQREILIRKAFQWPEWVKARFADFLVDNNGPLNKTKGAVNDLFIELLERAKNMG